MRPAVNGALAAGASADAGKQNAVDAARRIRKRCIAHP
jgi:hypothetical protein